MHDNDIPISVKELSSEYETSPLFKDTYEHITKGHILSKTKADALRRLKTECEDYLVIDNVLLLIKIPKDKNIKPSLL